jgi:hypothetical protein
VSQRGAPPLENDGTIGRKAAAAKIVEQIHAEDVAWVLSDVRGRRAVAWWTELFGELSSSRWKPGAEIHLLAGRADLALMILNDCLEASPEKYAALRHESIDVFVTNEIEKRGIHNLKEKEA